MHGEDTAFRARLQIVLYLRTVVRPAAAWLSQTRILQLRPEFPTTVIEFDRGKLQPDHVIVVELLAAFQPRDSAADHGALRRHDLAGQLYVAADYGLHRV